MIFDHMRLVLSIEMFTTKCREVVHHLRPTPQGKLGSCNKKSVLRLATFEKSRHMAKFIIVLLALAIGISNANAQPKVYESVFISALKKQALTLVGSREKQVQEMIDMIFSFGELGFHEVETSKYLTDILTKNGFTVKQNISNIPTAWMATWGSGSPVIALGSDIDCIPKASQKPGVAYKDPIVEGAPGHGEGHNSGQAVIIFAAIAVKELLAKNKMPGTIMMARRSGRTSRK